MCSSVNTYLSSVLKIFVKSGWKIYVSLLGSLKMLSYVKFTLHYLFLLFFCMIAYWFFLFFHILHYTGTHIIARAHSLFLVTRQLVSIHTSGVTLNGFWLPTTAFRNWWPVLSLVIRKLIIKLDPCHVVRLLKMVIVPYTMRCAPHLDGIWIQSWPTVPSPINCVWNGDAYTLPSSKLERIRKQDRQMYGQITASLFPPTMGRGIIEEFNQLLLVLVLFFRIACKKACSCSIQSATTNGSQTRLSSSSWTKRTCLSRRFQLLRSQFAFLTTKVYWRLIVAVRAIWSSYRYMQWMFTAHISEKRLFCLAVWVVS